ncbi:uncharacterized protein [Physcomitrium patens]|uniref:DNA endonuclease activator Ctp1 C-terminal domain-containing protein n=1 Tax=Physcomitrium patens TaxID=3218 RepID=A0A2K1J6T8_PHYPA|nr:protein gamma response 1-like [Physcomitrium patens]PNR37239.1 hypothetical protein PHYPA_020347 [Physcomitrium patens]|eukprot:XP_024398777.1 protein gamma response 1-like [Physcomitrella patens]
MEAQVLSGEETVDESHFTEGVSVKPGVSLIEARERLDRMGIMICDALSLKLHRELENMREALKRVEDEQASWIKERELMEGQLRTLRAELKQSQIAAAEVAAPPQIDDIDRGSEEIDLKAVAEHQWYDSRPILAPITPEAVRARTPVSKQGSLAISGVATPGKENFRSKQKSEESVEEIQRLRRENEQLRLKMRNIAKEYKGMKSQYNYLQTRLASKGDAGNLISHQDQLQAALEAGLEKPPKIRRRKIEEAQVRGGVGRSSGPVASDMHAPSNPVYDPPQTVAEDIAGPTASTSGSRDDEAKVKVEPVSPEAFKGKLQIPLKKNNAAVGLDVELERKPDRTIDKSAPAAMPNNRKRSLDSSGKQPSKVPTFKFVEPVRKKAEREALQATECKLCKKFYDAVLAEDANGVVESRCNHMDKSRHRYRDLPPATPEGFWNIGFDSDF